MVHNKTRGGKKITVKKTHAKICGGRGGDCKGGKKIKKKGQKADYPNCNTAHKRVSKKQKWKKSLVSIFLEGK